MSDQITKLLDNLDTDQIFDYDIKLNQEGSEDND